MMVVIKRIYLDFKILCKVVKYRYFIDIEDSGSEDDQNADVRSNKKNSELPEDDDPMDSANHSPKDSPNSVRKMSIGRESQKRAPSVP